MVLRRAIVFLFVTCVASHAADAAADAHVTLETPRLTLGAAPQLHAVRENVFALEEVTRLEAMEYDNAVKRAGRGRILLAAGVPMLVWGLSLAIWAATAEDCYNANDDLHGQLIAGSVMAGVGFALTSAAIVQLVRSTKKARRDRSQKRFRRWAIPIGIASGIISTSIGAGGLIVGTIGCYSS
ncbi:MAG: hypothetical protein WBG86_02435 [Polyangiales bacterium]